MEGLKEKDLVKKSIPELEELLNRQDKLLHMKGFIAKLPDKGLKIENTRKQIEQEIARRKERERLDLPLSASLQLSVTETLEWTGEYACDNEEIDSDDDSSDETDPLKILSSQAGAGSYKKKYRFEKREKSLVMPEDIREDNEPLDSTTIEMYANRLCHKDETVEKVMRGSYRPYQTVIPHEEVVGISSVKKKPTKGPHWEITAATPPHYVHGDVKSISLTESLTLQKEHTLKLKEVQVRHSADRLAVQIEKLHLRDGRDSSASTSTADEIVEEQEDELLEDDDSGGGIVVYSVND